jgi:hypothetical protein
VKARRLILLLAAVTVGLAAGCGGSELAAEPPPVAEPPTAPDEPPAALEEAWLVLLGERELEPDEFRVQIEGSREGSELVITITVPDDAAQEYTFSDGLYGAEAWAPSNGGWSRIDTADIRTEIAPLLAPGESAEVRLPVRSFEGGPPRILVPVEGFAAWADLS